MMGRMKAEHCAEVLLGVIPESIDRADFITCQKIMELTELTAPQVRAGAVFIKEHHPDLPLVSGPRGYSFTCNAHELEVYRLRFANQEVTRWSRMFSGAMRPWLQKTRHPDLQRIEDHFELLLRDIRRGLF